MSYTLIITEKPNASKMIAEALADERARKESINKVPYYPIKHKNKAIIVACAVGHLYGLTEKEKTKSFQYPVFETRWAPLYELNEGAAFSKKYLEVIRKLAKDANSFVVATDYDIEGEVIGLNCLRFICGQKDGRRMKFSTLTKPDLIEAYEKMSSHLDWGQAEAGLTRHELDWIYGINISRALSSAIKKAGLYKIMSSGRVQGPALKILAEREKEIRGFKPEPYWQIELVGDQLTAWHEKDKFWDKKEAERVYKKIEKEKQGGITKIRREEAEKQAPTPFDLTTLQMEAFRCFRISPKQTLEVAQNLYTHGLISYPRTSSQQLPASLNFKKIINSLMKQGSYKKIGELVLQTPLKPNNGKKTDPAHPAIYPTGIFGKLGGWNVKIYDLIVKRFFATFGESARRETVTMVISAENENFIAKGTTTTYEGWFRLYAPYSNKEEIELPLLKENDKVKIKRFNLHEKATQPPKRYTEASIIKELEKRNLGTKATRAQIVDTLVQRNYVAGKPFEATELGMHLVEVLDMHCPQIQDEELTREFEEDMEKVRDGSKKKENILKKAKSVLTKILNEFKGKELDIGKGLVETVRETNKALRTVGKCPNCKNGNLVFRKGKYGMFIACDSYPKCKTTFSLPAGAFVKATGKICEHCKSPLIDIIRRGKRPQRTCINQNCPSKKIKQPTEKRKCLQCKKGMLIVKRSIYGSFLACNRYPECRYIERIGKK